MENKDKILIFLIAFGAIASFACLAFSKQLFGITYHGQVIIQPNHVYYGIKISKEK